MANRKEERERLREARLEREREQKQGERKRLMLAYGIAAVVGIVVIAGIVILIASSGSSEGGGLSHVDERSGSTNGVQPDTRSGPKPPAIKVTNLQQAAKLAGCVLKLNLKDEGHTHIPPGSPTPHYHTNPPTSGTHVEPPFQQADGAYTEMPQEIDFVHSLEHGRIEFQYSPDLSEADQEALKGLYDTEYAGALLFPNEKMPFQVAATAWTKLLGCKAYKGSITLDALRDFGRANWGKYGGEPAEAFPFTGPTPAEPQS